MKKLLSIMCAVVLAVCAVCVNAFAAELPEPLSGDWVLLATADNREAWEGGPLQAVEGLVQGGQLNPDDAKQYLEIVVEARNGAVNGGVFRCEPNDWSGSIKVEAVQGIEGNEGIYTITVSVADFVKILTDAGLVRTSTMVHQGSGIAKFLEARLYAYTGEDTPVENTDTPVEDTEVDEPAAEDTPAETGLALSLIPAVIAMAVVALKRR